MNQYRDLIYISPDLHGLAHVLFKFMIQAPQETSKIFGANPAWANYL